MKRVVLVGKNYFWGNFLKHISPTTITTDLEFSLTIIKYELTRQTTLDVHDSNSEPN